MMMARSAPLRLTLLGGFRLSHGGAEIELAASGQRLVAFLAFSERPLSRSYVAGTLWPEFTAKRSLADLRTTLWRVNHAPLPVVTATHSHLRLGEHIEVDVRRLLTLARRLSEPARAGPDRPACLEDAPAIADLSAELLPDWYEEWLQDEREQLRQIRLHALEALSAVLSQAGRHPDAIQAALAAIRLEPLRETAHRALIEAHIAEGNWSEAHRQFIRCEQLLMDELGVAPSESTRQLLPGRRAGRREPLLSGVPARR
jgi:DNA-binding SARP family transcriptional activator